MKYRYIQKRQKNSIFKNNKSNYRKNRKLVAVRYFGRRIKRDLTNFFKWIFLAIITGLIVGGSSSAFAGCVREATAFRNSHLWIFMLLPLSSVLIVFKSLDICCKFFWIAFTKSLNIFLSPYCLIKFLFSLIFLFLFVTDSF